MPRPGSSALFDELEALPLTFPAKAALLQEALEEAIRRVKDSAHREYKSPTREAPSGTATSDQGAANADR